MIRFVLGCRPEAIKILPVIRALKSRGVHFEVIGTGQHAELLDGTGIRLDHNLAIASQNEPEAYVIAASQALQALPYITCGVQGDRDGRTTRQDEDSSSRDGASGSSGSRTPDTASDEASRERARRLNGSSSEPSDVLRRLSDESSATRASKQSDRQGTSDDSGPEGSDGTDRRLVSFKQASTIMRNVQHWSKVTTVVVQGDTASAVAGAEAAAARGIPVAHIESGLRSHDMSDPWPEEGYRIRIDNLSSSRYCPTGGNKLNLVHEGLTGEVVGNTITDALRHMGVKKDPEGGSIVLVTLHRRESFGEPLKDVLRGLAAAAHRHPNTPFCWPLHPNPRIRDALDAVSLPPNVLKRGPLAYRDFLTFLASAKAILTDSGGVIEEACTLGIPCVVARNHTERPEAMEVGSAKLVGTESKAVWEGLDWALGAEIGPSTVFGDGHAADIIADHLATL